MRAEGQGFDALLFALVACGLFLALVVSLSSLVLTAERNMEPHSWAERQCAGSLEPDEADSLERHRCFDRVLTRPAWHAALPEIVAAAGCFAVAIAAGTWRASRSRQARLGHW
jgi:hypothetical protein